jgi:hypothetical protein
LEAVIHGRTEVVAEGLIAGKGMRPATRSLPGMGKRHADAMIRIVLKCMFSLIFVLSLSGCLTQRTVSEGGHTVSQKYVTKRPIKEAVQNSR